MLCSPSREHRYIAEHIYSKTYQEGIDQGLHTDSSLLDWMGSQGYWKPEEEEILKGIEIDIDSLKVGLYESGLILSKSKAIKDTLRNAKLKLREYYSKKHRFDNISASYNASMAKLIYLLRRSIQTLDGRLVHLSSIGKLTDYISENKISDEDFRELARTEPWLSIYSIGQDVFGIPVVDLTEEQKSLLCWSMLYTNIRKHPECPSNNILEDDDALDGWLIVQKKKNSESINKKKVDEFITNDKIRNSDEIFVVVDNPEDAKIVEDMNDPLAAMRKKQRFNYLAEKGAVNELDMPDMKQKITMEINRMRGQK